MHNKRACVCVLIKRKVAKCNVFILNVQSIRPSLCGSSGLRQKSRGTTWLDVCRPSWMLTVRSTLTPLGGVEIACRQGRLKSPWPSLERLQHQACNPHVESKRAGAKGADRDLVRGGVDQ